MLMIMAFQWWYFLSIQKYFYVIDLHGSEEIWKCFESFPLTAMVKHLLFAKENPATFLFIVITAYLPVLWRQCCKAGNPNLGYSPVRVDWLHTSIIVHRVTCWLYHVQNVTPTPTAISWCYVHDFQVVGVYYVTNALI